MRTFTRLALLTVIVVATFAAAFTLNRDAAPRPAQAQDDGGAVVCDSTLALLVLLAEVNYGFLSRMDESMMTEMPNFELGQYTYIFQDALAMMMAMGEAEMSEEEMAATAEMGTILEGLMTMDAAGILAGYDTAMGHEAMEGATVLAPGNVADEPAECTALRAGVEQFIVAHLVAEAQMMMAMEEME